MVGLPRKYGGWHRCPLTRNLWPNSQWGARGSTERGERGQIGYQIGWNLKVSLSGKREASGEIGVLQFYIQRICTRTVEGLEPKIHYLPTKPLLFNLLSLLPERQSVTKQLWIWTLLFRPWPKTKQWEISWAVWFFLSLYIKITWKKFGIKNHTLLPFSPEQNKIVRGFSITNPHWLEHKLCRKNSKKIFVKHLTPDDRRGLINWAMGTNHILLRQLKLDEFS